MSELTGCLQTPLPKVFDFPTDISLPSDPVTWALDIFAANLIQADMQIREPRPGMPDELIKQLSGVLQSKLVDSKMMRRLLSNWWGLAMSRTIYQGPYPERA